MSLDKAIKHGANMEFTIKAKLEYWRNKDAR